MIGDNIALKPKYIFPAQEIVTSILPKVVTSNVRYFISIGGESGCGKSTLAYALKHCLELKGLSTCIFHMDDYFILPPKSNHDKRVADISWVGPQEVNLNLIKDNFDKIRLGEKTIEKPLVDYQKNSIGLETVNVSDCRVFIIEGTYTSLIDGIDLRIFIDRTYKDTFAQRMERARDEMTPFVESVLDIEHHIIASHKSMANIILNNDYSVQLV